MTTRNVVSRIHTFNARVILKIEKHTRVRYRVYLFAFNSADDNIVSFTKLLLKM